MPVETFADLRIWKISLEQIEATVSDFLGPGRVRGKHQSPTFSRHVSMYLARQVGGWSYPKISRFYNGRHHTTAIAATRRIERLRAQDESVGALLDMLTALLTPETDLRQAEAAKSRWQTLIVDGVSRSLVAKLPGRSIGNING